MMVNDIVMWLQLVIEVSDVVVARNPEILLLYLALYSNCRVSGNYNTFHNHGPETQVTNDGLN